MNRLSLMMRRTIRATPARLFEAWTQPEQLRAWWGPAEVACDAAEIDLRVGGAYRIANRLPSGEVLWISGEFEEITPPERLVYSWRLGADDPVSQRVIVRFEARPAGTEVIIVHERLRDEAMRADHRYGWEGCLEGLAAFLELGLSPASPPADPPPAAPSP